MTHPKPYRKNIIILMLLGTSMKRNRQSFPSHTTTAPGRHSLLMTRRLAVSSHPKIKESAGLGVRRSSSSSRLHSSSLLRRSEGESAGL